jgi:hypothetical protein
MRAKELASNNDVITHILRVFDQSPTVVEIERPANRRLFVATDQTFESLTIRRSHFLTGFVPWNITREKSELTQLRLLTTSTKVSPEVTVFSRDQTFPVVLTVDSTNFVIKGDRYDRTIKWSEITALIGTTDAMGAYTIEIIANHIPTVLALPRENLFTTRPNFGQQNCPHLRIDAQTVDRAHDVIREYMMRWIRGEISSFKYLSVVNTLIGRTYEHLHDIVILCFLRL